MIRKPIRVLMVYAIFLSILILHPAALRAGWFDGRGKLIRNSAIEIDFQYGTVDGDLIYYWAGDNPGSPDGIIGVNKAYVLDPKGWKPIENPSDELPALVERMLRKAIENFGTVYGCKVTDRKGKVIGIWFSPDDETVVETTDNKVTVRPPDTEVTNGCGCDP
jgi:hypothetical protein